MQINGVENECLISITARKGFFLLFVSRDEELIGKFFALPRLLLHCNSVIFLDGNTKGEMLIATLQQR